MKMDRKGISFLTLVSLLVMAGMFSCSCNREPVFSSKDEDGNIIKVGGITSNSVGMKISTKASDTTYEGLADDPDAENGEDVSWMIDPLKEGFDVVYGSNESNTHMASLKLNQHYSADNPTIQDGEDLYSFVYKTTEGGVTAGKKARWYDNGDHFFRGTSVPDALFGSLPKTYDDLSRYIAIPVNTKIPATVGSIRIPYKHRLARMIVYVLIDPLLTGDDNKQATLSGYALDEDGKDDPTNTSLWFRDVQILDKVENRDDFTYPVPIWKKEVSMTPHFLSEISKVEYNKTQDVMIVEDGDEGSSYSANEGDEVTIFRNVPVYDIIVRPTYDDEDCIMYDEEDQTKLPKQNTLEINMTLSNGLEYNESFSFDLNANQQTFLFVKISAERVDFAESNSHVWSESSLNYHYFGVNNPRYNLSDAGSNWQRAWRIGSNSDKVQDGEKYWDPNDRGQYISMAKWIEKFKKAIEGGDCHGDYFILDQDITLDLPADFVFTGHLDARGHIVSTSSDYLFAGLNGNYITPQESDMNQTWEANVHWEEYDADYGNGTGGVWIPLYGYRAEIYNTIVSGGNLLKETPSIKTGYIYNCYDALHPTSDPKNRIDFVYGE